MDRRPVVVAATFTADFIGDALGFWLKMFGADTNTDVVFAPQDQVFQSLLDPSSLLRKTAGIGAVLVRIADLGAAESAAQKACADLLVALGDATADGRALFLGVCPSRFDGAPPLWVDTLERQLASGCAAMKSVHAFLPEDVARDYPVSAIFDPYREKLGRVPYTDPYFTALATVLARRIRAQSAEPKKVIVVDCDDTLWGGLCAEAGPQGVVIDEPRRALQAFLLEQRAAGMLLCISSRNNEPDALAVFDQRADMILKREHVVTHRINWMPKSESIRSMAAELNLGIDSMVFLDDDRFVCAEVRERCPGITAIQIPSDTSTLPSFLRHLWLFDRLRVTAEDRRRSELYEQNAARERSRAQMSLGAFLASLELEIRIAPMESAEIPRVAQLTQRTNQFNATTERLAEADVSGLGARDRECLTVDVSDRFGAYGLVGVVIFGPAGDELHVDAFLLSCRVLGRGVEHRIASELGRIAVSRGKKTVRFPFRPTKKNAPFATFFSDLPAARRGEERDVQFVHVDAAQAASLTYDPDAAATAAPVVDEPAKGPALTTPASAVDFAHIATSLRTVDSIAGAIAQARQKSGPEASTEAELTDLEKELAAMWCEELGLSSVGIHDDFLAVGGTSLLAVKLLSRIDETLDVMLPLTTFFDSPTIAILAKTIAEARGDGASVVDARPQLRKMEAPAGGAPLTSVQYPIWVLHQLEQFNPMTVTPFATRITGPLPLESLEAALRTIVERQASLRLVFETTAAGPVQRVTPAHAPSEWLRVVDLRSEPSAVWRVAGEITRQPFDVARGPVFRFAVLRTRDDEHIFLAVMSHLAGDIWSVEILQRELAHVLAKKDAALVALPVTYIDYALWEKEWRTKALIDTQRAYWQEKLAGTVPELPFPAPPDLREWASASSHADLSPELIQTIEAVARREKTTFFTILLAAYNSWLHKHAKAEDIWVGVSTGNRDLVQIQDLIGQFVNMVFVRTAMRAESSALDVLRAVQDSMRGAMHNRDIRYHELLTMPHLRRSRDRLARLPTINFNESWPRSLEMDGIRYEPLLKVYDVLNAASDRENDYLVVTKAEGSSLRFYPSKLWHNTFESADATLKSFLAHLGAFVRAI